MVAGSDVSGRTAISAGERSRVLAPRVRVRAAGIAAGREDPGGRHWIVPVVVGAFLTVRLLRGRSRRRG